MPRNCFTECRDWRRLALLKRQGKGGREKSINSKELLLKNIKKNFTWIIICGISDILWNITVTLRAYHLEWHIHGSQCHDCNPLQAINALIKLNIRNEGRNSCRLYGVFHLIVLYQTAALPSQGDAASPTDCTSFRATAKKENVTKDLSQIYCWWKTIKYWK